MKKKNKIIGFGFILSANIAICSTQLVSCKNLSQLSEQDVASNSNNAISKTSETNNDKKRVQSLSKPSSNQSTEHETANKTTKPSQSETMSDQTEKQTQQLTHPLTKLTPASPVTSEIKIKDPTIKPDLQANEANNVSKSEKQELNTDSSKPLKNDPKQELVLQIPKVENSEINNAILSARHTGFNYYSQPDYHFGKNAEELIKDQELKLELLDKQNEPVEGVKWYVRIYYPNDVVYELKNNLNKDTGLVYVNDNTIKGFNDTDKEKNVEVWGEYQGGLYQLKVKIWNHKQSQNIAEYNQSLKRVKELSQSWHHLSPLQRALKAYEWLCNNVRYQEGQYLGDDQTAYSAIIGLASVCTGYAKGFKMFMDELKIPNILLTGDVGSEKHIWNMIELDDGWYHVDATWGAKKLGRDVNYNYFLVNDYDLKIQNRKYNNRFPFNQMGQKYRAYKLNNFITSEEDIKKIINKQLMLKTNNNILQLHTPYTKQFEPTVKNVIEKMFQQRSNPYAKRNPEMNMVKYEYFLPKLENSNIKSVNLTIEKHTNSKSSYILKINKNEKVDLNNENIFVEGAFIKSIENYDNHTLVYLYNFDDLKNQNIKINVYKIGYDFKYEQKTFTFDVLQQSKPEGLFVGNDNKSGKIINVDETIEYRIDVGVWQSVQGTSINLNETGTKTVSLRKKANATHLLSEVQVIKPFKPRDLDREIKIYNGYVTGVDNSMQYRVKGTDKWIDIRGNKILLPSGTYDFWIKPGNGNLAGEIYTLQV
ncbi:putative lipoprotein [Mycoplasmopsis californica]|uniref:Putative lipoprotein n=1 Tax=Mycoplasmopsis californica TaxID=2113 RepID=A0A059XW01_9BACT|nr:transglutaminase domain-containing protein [Mycoplasmopsis californica]AIA29427.1 putative lipoprotein [Mycoplasmopsis californica]